MFTPVVELDCYTNKRSTEQSLATTIIGCFIMIWFKIKLRIKFRISMWLILRLELSLLKLRMD